MDRNIATMQKAQAFERSMIKGDPYTGNIPKLMENIDRWKEVFTLKTQGMSLSAIARVMNINRKTASSWYHRYIELQSSVLTTRLETNQMLDIAETLQRLEHQREEVALELSTMSTISMTRDEKGRFPQIDPQEYAAKLATRKQLLEIEKQICEIKKGLGIWQEYQPGDFTEAQKRLDASRATTTQQSKLDRIQGLLDKAKQKKQITSGDTVEKV